MGYKTIREKVSGREVTVLVDKTILPKGQKTITNSLGVYHRALETDTHVYFVNFLESDENAQVKMYKKNNKVLILHCNNYFASEAILQDLEEEPIWISNRMQKEWELYCENEGV